MNESGAPVRAHVVCSEDGLADVMEPWWRLFDRVHGRAPYLAPDWMCAWWDAFATENDRMHLLLVWRGDTLDLVAPLLTRLEPGSSTRVPTLRFWSNVYSNRVIPLVDPKSAPELLDVLARHLVTGLGATWRRIVLDHVPMDSPSVVGLLQSLRKLGANVGIEAMHASPYLALPSTTAEVEATLSGRFRESVRRSRRVSERSGLSVEFQGDVSGLAHVRDVCRDSWQHAEGTGISSIPRVWAFYQRVASAWAEKGWLELALLNDGERAIAFEFNACLDGRVSNLKMGYRTASAALSPGRVLRDHSIQRAVQAGCREFDFLGVADAHKRQWTRSTRQLGVIEVYSRRGLEPALYWSRHVLRPWIRARFPSLYSHLGQLRRSLKALSLHRKSAAPDKAST